MSQSSPAQLSLVHLVRPPQTQSEDQPPLLVQLHGIGSNERDLFTFAHQLDPRCLVVSVRAPRVMGRDSFAWFEVEFLPQGFVVNADQLRVSYEALVQFIGEATAAYQTDPQRVYLLGFSQGGIMSLTLALAQPALIAGTAAMSSRIPQEVVPWFAPKEQLMGLPLLMVHGTKDGVIPISYARQARETLADLPVDLTYQEYEMRHEVTPESLNDVLIWITARLDGPRRTK
jgi:phospholipase/carboxylesterase